MTPKVTVLVPAYNVASYIREAIGSVLTQHMTDFELLVIDDGSTDETAQIVGEFSDSHIRLIRRPHMGIAETLNYGLTQAKGYYIARFDADDICLPGRLQRQVDFLDNNNDHIVCGGNAEYMDANGDHLFYFESRYYAHDDLVAQIDNHCPFIHSAVMYRKETILEAGSYPVHAHNFEDHLLWKMLAGKGKFANLPQYLIRVRFNPFSVTIDEKWRGERFRLLKQRIIRQGSASPVEGHELATIINNQDLKKLKEGAYYALCGKKFLVDNHQPAKARTHLSKAIRIYPLRWDNYALYMLSFMPHPVIEWLHRKSHYQTLRS